MGWNKPDRYFNSRVHPNFKLVCWNIEGLPSKVYEPGFLNYLANFDICCLVETFTSCDFDFGNHFSEYNVFHSAALKLSHRGRRSGGILILVKKVLQYEVTHISCSKDNMLILKVKQPSLGTDLIILCAYVPPVDSPYYENRQVKCNISVIEEELFRLQTTYPKTPVLICGDLNARTGSWNVHCDREDEVDSFEEITMDECMCREIVSQRHSQDLCTNHFGEILVNLCKIYHLCILNGSVSGDEMGRFTYISNHGNSVIDYCLLATNGCSLPFNVHFRIGSEIHSSHLPIELVVGNSTQPTVRSPPTERVVRKFVWDPKKLQEVKANLEATAFYETLGNASDLLTTDIDSALNTFVQMLLSSASCMMKTFFTRRTGSDDGFKWFDLECRLARRKVRDALWQFRKHGLEACRDLYVTYRSEYKRLIRLKKSEHFKIARETLLKCVSNASQFWSLVRRAARHGPKQPHLDIQIWRSHFQSVFNRQTYPCVVPELSLTVTHEDLDAPITEADVKMALARMSSGKAAGLDGIPGDYLKFLGNDIVPFLTKLFSEMYEKQYFPKSWCHAIIVPIHKSGNSLDPRNYRGISLLSNMSKLFMSILSNRLRFWAEEEGKLNFEQAGFRSDHSTIDHIFTLHSMAVKSVYGEGRGKFYVAFVDFEKAFDTIDRGCMWNILNKLGLSSKFLKMLQAVYTHVEASVRCGNTLSDPFHCPIGVRQGAVESPTIFNLYVTYVANFIRENGKHGVQLLPGTQEIFSLWFADDVALLSTTPAGLQRQLDSLSSASKHLGLSINNRKTKVMVFRRGGFLAKGERWSIGGENLEVVNRYKYLGFIFTTKISLTAPLDDQAVRAKQKTVQLLRTMRSLHTQSVTVFFKLFDAQVLPALLYGAQLWGLMRRHTIETAHTFACKRFLGVDLKSSNSMCYGELGRYPVFIAATLQAIKYWLRIRKMPDCRLPKQSYLMLTRSGLPDEMNWPKSVETCLSNLGFSYIFNNCGTFNENQFVKRLKERLRDCYLQEWSAKLSSSDRFMFYRALKTSFQCEDYLSCISITKFRNAYVRFRFGCNELKTNYRPRKDYDPDMKCPFCVELENESHFVFRCKMYDDIRQKYLRKHLQKVDREDLTKLLNGKDAVIARDVSMFIYYSFQRRALKVQEACDAFDK